MVAVTQGDSKAGVTALHRRAPEPHWENALFLLSRGRFAGIDGCFKKQLQQHYISTQSQW